MYYLTFRNSCAIIVSLVLISLVSQCLGESQNDLNLADIKNRSQNLMRHFYRGLLQDKPVTLYPDLKLRSHTVKKTTNSNFLRVCYYSFGDPEPSKINGTLCTHIIKGFTSIQNGTLSPGNVTNWILTTNLKKQYPHLKVMLSVGGGGNANGFTDAAASKQNRSKFIRSCIKILTYYNFDGLDIDWEFPVWNDFVESDKKNFVLLLRDFKYAVKRMETSLLLSIAVAAPKGIVDDAYDVPAISRYVDFINLMSYDYHDYTFYTPFTGHNSPLFNRSVEHAYFATLNTAWSSLYWAEKGMPYEKIMVGLPTYGHTYTLLTPSLHGLDDPAVGYGSGSGTISFPEVCQFLRNGGTRVFDEESQVPYAYKDFYWLGYDDYSSITAKTQWVKSKKFGGVMTFDLNCDDWQGICDGKTTFPLHQIIYDILTSP